MGDNDQAEGTDCTDAQHAAITSTVYCRDFLFSVVYRIRAPTAWWVSTTQ